MSDVTLVVSPTPLETAGALLAQWLADVHHARGGARLGIPGGSAVAALEQAVRTLAPAVWANVSLTWVDERLVPTSSDESNQGLARRRGLLSVSPLRVLPLVVDGETSAAAIERVSHALARDFDGALDVALLGLGEDGHVASLFPGHPALHATGSVTAIVDSPKPPPHRITLTIGVLAREATKRLVVATGAGKRAAIERVLAGDETLPTTALGALTLVTDQRFDRS